jgi:hypothetical protein
MLIEKYINQIDETQEMVLLFVFGAVAIASTVVFIVCYLLT